MSGLAEPLGAAALGNALAAPMRLSRVARGGQRFVPLRSGPATPHAGVKLSGSKALRYRLWRRRAAARTGQAPRIATGWLRAGAGPGGAIAGPGVPMSVTRLHRLVPGRRSLRLG
ncbi:hypothetical protein [Yunchengibacter salinarum]|uniref:hypothetical protein n=1 Tax=Yunchengibacter salinarum TaxID=3133399 RepID=UPI0035B660C0